MEITNPLLLRFILVNRKISGFLDRYHWHQYRLLILLAILPLIFAWNDVTQLPNGMIYLVGWLVVSLKSGINTWLSSIFCTQTIYSLKQLESNSCIHCVYELARKS